MAQVRRSHRKLIRKYQRMLRSLAKQQKRDQESHRRLSKIRARRRMPNRDGLTFLTNVPAGMRVIVMSAYLDRPEFEAAATHKRVFCTIAKPFKPATIREAFNRFVAENPKPVEVEKVSGQKEQPSS
jgi:DNA-binding NtrC family response regulator